MEEFLPGFQGTVEGIVQGGKIAWMTLLDRQTATPPFVVTRGHRLPSTLSAEQIAAVRAELNRLWSILEYRDGPFDCDFVLAPHGVVILEATPRLGGNGITGSLDTRINTTWPSTRSSKQWANMLRCPRRKFRHRRRSCC